MLIRVISAVFKSLRAYWYYLIIGSIVVGTNYITYELVTAAHTKDALAAASNINDLQAKVTKSDAAIALQLTELEQEVATAQRVVTKEVIRYVSSPSTTTCTFDTERVRIKNSAITGANTEPTSTPID